MNNQQVENIQKQLNLRETEDLVEIWQEHDKSQWTEAAFTAIQNILTNRLGEAPLFEDTEPAKKLIEQAEDFLETEELYKALDKSDLAIQLAPHYGYAYYIKGLIFDEMEKPEEAIKLYQEALKFSPNLKEARQNLSWAFDDAARKNIHPDERILAALAHGSIIGSIFGMIVPAIIWITQREKSHYVAFQSLQALVFQGLAAGFQLMVGLLTIFRTLASSINNPLMQTTLSRMLSAIGVIELLQIIFWIWGLIGVFLTLRGKHFKYIGVSKITQKLMLPS